MTSPRPGRPPKPPIDRSSTAAVLQWTESRIGLEKAINSERERDQSDWNDDLLQVDGLLTIDVSWSS